MIPYQLVVSPAAARKIVKLDPSVVQRIRKELISLTRDPSPLEQVKRLKGHNNPPLFSLRVGDYRVIVEIHNDKMIIVVVQVGPRRTVYRDF